MDYFLRYGRGEHTKCLKPPSSSPLGLYLAAIFTAKGVWEVFVWQLRSRENVVKLRGFPSTTAVTITCSYWCKIKSWKNLPFWERTYPLKWMVGIQAFLLGNPIFRCELLVSGRVCLKNGFVVYISGHQGFFVKSSRLYNFLDVGNSIQVVISTHLKNMRTSNWIISPRSGVKIKKCVKPPASLLLFLQNFKNYSPLGKKSST